MTGAVLVGGKSRRMGFNKAFIEVNGRPIIERAIETLRSTFSPLILVASKDNILDYQHLNIRVVADIYDGAGSLGGIYTALFHSTSPYCFVTACDMPCLDTDIIKRMCADAGGYDAVIPFINDRFHPLHALYSRRCMQPMEKMITEGDLTISNLYPHISVRKLDETFFHGPSGLSFLSNINTREDLLDITGETTQPHNKKEMKEPLP